MKAPIFFAVALSATVSFAAENLLVNPGFTGAENGKPAGWKVYSTGLPAPKLVTLKDGKTALALVDEATDKGGGYFQIVPCEPGAKYELSCEVLPIDGKVIGHAAIQISGKNLFLRPGKNVLGVAAKPDQKKLNIYVWTPKPQTGRAYIRDLTLRKVEQFSPETAIDGKRPRPPRAAKAVKKAGAPKKLKGVPPPPKPDEIVVKTDGKQAVFTLPHDGLWEIDAIMSSPRHPRFGAFVRVSMDGGPWCNSMIRNYNPMDHSLSPMMILWHYKAGKHILRYDTYDPVLKDQVKIHEFRIHPFRDVKVPEAAKNYKPAIVPPQTRPRVLFTQETLPRVRKNLAFEPNKTIWENMLKLADQEYTIHVKPDQALGYNATVCKLVRAKFLAYLLTREDKYFQSGRKLLISYLKRLNFVKTTFYYYNHGEMLYTTALAYDWAYDRFTDEEKTLMRKRMDFFAHTMETGYPPFAQHITYGHGNGAQSHNYLPPWAIAIYDEDPVPYQYCAYRVLEQLVPQRAVEYSSGRHAEGSPYAIARFKGDLYTALHYKMHNGGKEIFHPNINDIYMNFIYVTLPNGKLFNNGDGWTEDGNSAYCAALAAANSGHDPHYIRHMWDVSRKGFESMPERILAWFDPTVKPAEDYTDLPLTRHQPGVFSSLNLRTGWNMNPVANDAVLEFNAKEFNLGGHAHRDTGTFQIYYRGLLAGDIGQYKIFGVPYDSGFGKRTVSHSAMLVHNPAEQMTAGNDGGQRSGGPIITAEGFKDPARRFAATLAVDFGPVKNRPLYNVLKSDMTAAYPAGRLQKHIRSFYFLNFNDPEYPGAVIVADRVESQYTKYFQVNSLRDPEVIPGGIKLTSNDIPGMPGHLYVNMLRPRVQPEILTGKMASNVFGTQYTPPRPEIKSSRTMFPARNGESDFTAVMQITAGKTHPVHAAVSGEAYVIRLKDWTLAIADKGGLIAKPFTFEAAGFVLLADLAAGDWTIEGQGFVAVEKGKHTAFMKLPAGKYTARPGRSGSALPACREEAKLTPSLADTVTVNNKILPGIRPEVRNGRTYVDARAVSDALGKKFNFTREGVLLAGRVIELATLSKDGKLYVDAAALGAMAGTDTFIDEKVHAVTCGGSSAAASCFHIASSNGKSAVGLFNGKSGWVHNSPNGFFTVRFLVPKMLKGMDLYAVSMQDPFVVEISDDGKNWRLAAAGETNPVSGAVTPIRFQTPQKVDFLRFRFKGSKTHPHWNTMSKIILKE